MKSAIALIATAAPALAHTGHGSFHHEALALAALGLAAIVWLARRA